MRQSPINTKIFYYMQNGDKYYDDFFIEYYEGRDACKQELAQCFAEIQSNDYKITKCSTKTKELYNRLYSNISRAMKADKERTANSFFLNFINDDRMNNLFEEYGLSAHGNVVQLTDKRKAAKIYLDMVISKLESE